MRTWLVAAGLLGVLLLVATGCGSKKSAATTTTTSSSSSGSAASGSSSSGSSSSSSSGSSSGSSSSSSSGGTPSFAGAKNCAQLASLAAKVGAAVSQSSSSNPEDALKNESKALQALASAAPSAIKGDLQTFSAAFSQFAGAIAKSGYTPGKVPTAKQIAALQAASQSLDTQKIKAAEAHLEAWGKTNCPNLAKGSNG